MPSHNKSCTEHAKKVRELQKTMMEGRNQKLRKAAARELQTIREAKGEGSGKCDAECIAYLKAHDMAHPDGIRADVAVEEVVMYIERRPILREAALMKIEEAKEALKVLTKKTNEVAEIAKELNKQPWEHNKDIHLLVDFTVWGNLRSMHRTVDYNEQYHRSGITTNIRKSTESVRELLAKLREEIVENVKP